MRTLTRSELAENLYREHHDRLVLVLGRRFSATPAETIEDGVQFAYQQLLAQPAAWEPRDELFAWLYVVAYRGVLRHIERHDNREAPLPDVDAASIEPDVDAAIDARIATHWLAKHLTRRELQALGYRSIGATYTEIAAVTGWTPRTVERQVLRGRGRARAVLTAAAVMA